MIKDKYQDDAKASDDDDNCIEDFIGDIGVIFVINSKMLKPAGRRRRNSSMSSLPKTANRRVSNASSTPEIFGIIKSI